MSTDTTLDVLVVGAGFVGAAVVRRALAGGLAARGWTRTPRSAQHRRFLAADGTDRARLLRCRARCVVVTFPCTDLPVMVDTLVAHPGHAVLLGTTGCYVRGPEITEDSLVRPDHPRRTSEEAVLACGGTVLHLAGLYGGPRDPLRWLAAGRVGREPRQANLVHRDDVADLILAVARDPEPGAFVVSDGERHTWAEIAQAGHRAGRLDVLPPARAPRRANGFVAPRKAQARWPAVGYRSLIAALADTEGCWP